MLWCTASAPYSPPLRSGTASLQVTTLENGLKVASSDLPTPAATIGLYIESGSAFDEIPGTAHLIQHMAFKSSSSVSQLKMVTVCEALGAAVYSLSYRENTVTLFILHTLVVEHSTDDSLMI